MIIRGKQSAGAASRGRGRVVLATVAAASLTLAACGGDDDDAGTAEGGRVSE